MYENEYRLADDEKATVEEKYAGKDLESEAKSEFPASTELNIPEEYLPEAPPKEEKSKNQGFLLFKRFVIVSLASLATLLPIYANKYGSHQNSPLPTDVSSSVSSEDVSSNLSSDAVSSDVSDITQTPTDDSFPDLPNKDPDFAGKYAWSGQGSEEYVRFIPTGSSQYAYLEMGSVWSQLGNYDENGNLVKNELTSVPNARYDADTNTLTLENFSAHVLDINLMGNGFTVNLIGNNSVDLLSVWGAYYGGSVTFTGSGSLTVNKDGNSPQGIGIYLHCEESESCLMAEKEATVDVYGEIAVLIESSLHENGIYLRNGSKLSGGEPAAFDTDKTGVYDHTVVDSDGQPSKHVTISPER